jgi:hypothetical protein
VDKTCLIALCFLTVSFSHARSTAQKPLHFDLSKIGMVVNGRQMCEDKGRLQDVPSRVMDQIVAGGSKSVPVLIGMIADTRTAQTEEPIICYWPGMAVGDIAFCLLGDLFTDSTYTNKTIPGASWDDMLGPGKNVAAADQLQAFIKKHGRAALQAKWRLLWDRYGDQIFWDPKERCFRLKTQ